MRAWPACWTVGISPDDQEAAMDTATNRIGVGIVGGSPGGGWAALAHIPAVQNLPQYELRAVSTSRAESARQAAQAFGVRGYDDHRELIADPAVDLVVVAVRVPFHHEIVSAALAAGKMVYCEWPLGNGLDEAVDLHARATKAGVMTAVGLQGRFAPAVARAAELVADGYVGRVLATTMVGSGLAWGPELPASQEYLTDDAHGATTLTVTTMHAVDALCWVLGEVDAVSAELAVGHPEIRIIGEGRVVPVTSPDQIVIAGRLEDMAPVSVFFRGGRSRGTNFRWEINGSEGDLVLTAEDGNIQVMDARLEGARGEERAVREIALVEPLPTALQAVPDGPAKSVARLYEQLARDIRDGTRGVPDFAHAVRRHRLAEAVVDASRIGQRVAVA
jgi:predicted dehydrogenase